MPSGPASSREWVNEVKEAIATTEKLFANQSAAAEDLSIEDLEGMEGIVKIAKMKIDVSYATTIKSSAKEIIGSCVSSGIKVENKPAKEIYSDLNDGKFDQILV